MRAQVSQANGTFSLPGVPLYPGENDLTRHGDGRKRQPEPADPTRDEELPGNVRLRQQRELDEL